MLKSKNLVRKKNCTMDLKFLILTLVLTLLPANSSTQSTASDSSDSDLAALNSCPDLSIFNSCFLKEVQKSSALQEIFNLNEVSSQDEATGLLYICMAEAAGSGDKKSAYHAHLATRFITDCATDLTPAIMNIYSNTLAKFLKSQEVLDQNNACSLAEEYAEATVKSGQNVMKKCIPKSKVGAIDMAVEDFLNNHQAFTSEDSGQLNYLFGLEYLEPFNYIDYSSLIDGSDSDDSESSDSDDSGDSDSSDSSGQCQIDFPFEKSLCNTDDPAVAKFVSGIESGVSDYEDVFNLNGITIGVVIDGMFYLSLYYLTRRNNSNPAQLADYLSNVVRETQDNIDLQCLRALEKGLAKYMIAGGYLTEDNAEALAKKYLEALKENWVFIVNDAYPESKLVALFKSVVEFLSSLGAFGPEDGEDIIFYVGNEIRCLMTRDAGE